ncbi:DUF4342 domain-containing protein [Acidaminobacter hydrogenoformans]|uniref:DUF4342 domain-containing protein n=1 Tax=Acidaminobacter hydrogenoformans DSM 2784 TaxID=1120920 RepID=A0A1G5RTW1_9FIRM|nr:DUF4342 domain-containing protein [Acidaminobacter hydrogenoformans]SCZ77150.1 protein of unknown function [Acidaminobacter hydrogenoformans DSM 2784]
MSTVTIEMVDEVRNRTDADYKLAKEALEICGGDVLEAVIYIESLKTSGEKQRSEFINRGTDLIEKLRELVSKGVITRILVMKNEHQVMNIPVIAGGVAALVFTTATIAGILAAVATGCHIKVVKEDGEILDLNDMTEESFKNFMDATEKTVQNVKDKLKKTADSEVEIDPQDEFAHDPDGVSIVVDEEELESYEKEDDHYFGEGHFMEHGAVEEDEK